MTSDVRVSPSRLLAAAALGVLAAAFSFPAAPAGEGQERAERFAAMVASLDAGSARREAVGADIYNELRGEHRDEMRANLKIGLFQGSLLVQLGVLNVLAMQGDPGDLDDFRLLAESTRRFEVRTEILRLLPAFALWNNERARLAFIRRPDSGAADAAVLASLRRPPLTRRGRLDRTQDGLRADIAGVAGRMFDPVAAALGRISDPSLGDEAKAAVAHYVGSALGNDPDAWVEIWEDQWRNIRLDNAEEIEEIRLAALATLADMGAEGTPGTIRGFEFVFSLGEDILAQAALETLSAMCAAAAGETETLGGMGDGEEERAWIERRRASFRRLCLYAADVALPLSDSGSEPVALAAIACLGASASFPEADGVLAERRREAVDKLARVAMSPGSGLSARLAAIKAMGGIGTGPAVELIGGMLASVYASPEEGRAGQDVVEASAAALVNIARSGGAGAPAARESLLGLLADERSFPSPKAGTPPVRVGHIVMWRLQRAAGTSEISADPEFWRQRLGWGG